MPPRPRKDIRAGLPAQGTISGPMTRYDPALAMRVLESIAAGMTRKQIEADPTLPAFVTFVKWTLLDPKLREAWEEARRISALLLEDRALQEAEDITSPKAEEWSGTRMRAAEIAMNQWRWSAARRDRATFGDRNEASLVVPVQINTTLDLGNGMTRHMPSTDAVVNPYRVEVEVEEQDSDAFDAEWEDQPEPPVAQTPREVPPIPTPPDTLSSPLAQKPPVGRTPNAAKRAKQGLSTKKLPASARPRKSRIEENLK